MSSFWLGVAILVMAGLDFIGAVAKIQMVGQERKPVTSSDAAWYVLLAAPIIVFLTLAGLRLLGRA